MARLLFDDLHQDVIGQAAGAKSEPMVVEPVGPQSFLNHYEVVQCEF